VLTEPETRLYPARRAAARCSLRAIGTAAMDLAGPSWLARTSLSPISVETSPGATVFTLMPCGRSSKDSTLASASLSFCHRLGSEAGARGGKCG
jgi:hypothetical protein